MRKGLAKSSSSTCHDTLKLLKNWRLGTLSFEKVQSGPDVEPQPSSERNRSVDLDVFKDRKEFWEDQYLFRRRYGTKGTRAIWKAFRKLPIDSSPNIYRTEELWQGFVELALEDWEVLEDLVRYVKDFHERHGVKPDGNPNLYSMLIGHALGHRTDDVRRLHDLLKFLQPNQTQLCDFVASLGDEEPALSRYMEFCAELPSFKEMYGFIIPRLCKKGMHNVAVRWHHFLVGKGDLPANVEVSRSLLDYLSTSGRSDEAVEMEKAITVQETEDSTVEQAGDSIDNTVPDSHVNLPNLVRGLDQKVGIQSKNAAKISDEFCARVFATKFFSVSTIINGLRMLGLRELGPLALREMLLRATDDETCDVEAINQSLTQLESGGTRLANTKYCRVVKQLSRAKSAELLYEIATCDQHPHVFDDWKLQESLVAQYQAMDDQRQIQRTLHVLTLDDQDCDAKIHSWNIVLRAAITRRDRQGMIEITSRMRDLRYPVTHRTRQYMFNCLTPDPYNKGQISLRSLIQLKNIWQNLLLSGNPIQPTEWLEILRQFGKLNRVDDYESLALWLLRWYGDPQRKWRQVQLSNTSPVHGKSERHLDDPAELIMSLFSPAMIHGVITWGYVSAYQLPTPQPRIQGSTQEERVSELTQHRSLWGLRFLAKLRQHGVAIPRGKVARACEIRLVTAFGHGRSMRRIHRRARRMQPASLEEFVLAMEQIWGRSLFMRRRPIGRFCEDLLRRGQAKWNRLQLRHEGRRLALEKRTGVEQSQRWPHPAYRFPRSY